METLHPRRLTMRYNEHSKSVTVGTHTSEDAIDVLDFQADGRVR